MHIISIENIKEFFIFSLTYRIKNAILNIDIWGGMPMPKPSGLDEKKK